MTLRDYFAAAALPQIQTHLCGDFSKLDAEDIAKIAYEQADAMIAQREK